MAVQTKFGLHTIHHQLMLKKIMITKPTKRDSDRERMLWESFRQLRKVVIVSLILGLGFALFYISGFGEFANLETLKAHRHWISGQAKQYPSIITAVFMLTYIMSVALSLPIGTLLTILGGYIFGQTLGAVYVVTSATTGACIIFSLAKTALGVSLRERAEHNIKIMEPGFQKNALYYMLFLRLIPIFPFFIVNIVPAFLGVSLRPYLLGTFFGIIPSTFIFATAGASLGSIFRSGNTFTIDDILTPDSIILLCTIATFTLLPVLYRWLKRRANQHINAGNI